MLAAARPLNVVQNWSSILAGTWICAAVNAPMLWKAERRASSTGS